MRTCWPASCALLFAGVAFTQTVLEPEQLQIGGATFDVTFGEGTVKLPGGDVRKWISDAAEAVTCYFGRFPVKYVKLRVFPTAGRSGVFHGTTWGRDFGGLTRISLGENTTPAELKDDWMLTHEFVHMGFPSVADENHWIEEGMATYVEPIARVQAGQLEAARIWGDMYRFMPQGEPEPGDEGLDRTHTWGRTYWGGALFLLVADVRIHERTQNKKGLQDALRAILNAGGNIQADWPITKALQTGDEATGTTVLTDLYNENKDRPVTVDLPALWKRLGVERSGRTATFRDDAPLAAVRKAITAKR